MRCLAIFLVSRFAYSRGQAPNKGTTMKKIHLIHAHQQYEGISSGGLNKAMAGVIQSAMEARGFEVRQTHIEQGYEVDHEVQNHLWADLIILQSPVYWFGMPWIYKKYVDEVFTAGMMQGVFITGDGRSREDAARQYGTGGLLQGKQYMMSLTWNAPAAAFGDPNQTLFEGRSVDDVFVLNTANYKFCGMEILPAFSCHDVMKAPAIEADMARLQQHLASLV
jgi:modulator of drug activity B